MNWVDWIIVVVVSFYVLEGWEAGLVILLTNLFSFLASLYFAIKLHVYVGNFLVEKLGIAPIWTQVLGYVIVGVVSHTILSQMLSHITNSFPEKVFTSRINRLLGAVLSLLNSMALTAFFLLLILSLPLRGSIKSDIKTSKIGSVLVTVAETYGGQVKSSLDEVTKEAIKFLTVEPKSTVRIPLNVSVDKANLLSDEEAERIMVDMVNVERKKIGAAELRIDTDMIRVARKHSYDMFERKYFSHIDPDGRDAAYRMTKDGVAFYVVGENLAYAPTTAIAFEGLMNSDGHRRNILDLQFKRIGIGVVDGGIYGKMFTQLFAN